MMATKNHETIDLKYSSTADSNGGQYSSLNLNHNNRISNEVLALSENVKHNSGRKCQDDFKSGSRMDQLSSRHEMIWTSKVLDDVFGRKKEILEEKESSKSDKAVNNSTLSLHIVAYENFIGNTHPDSVEDQNLEKQKVGKFVADRFSIEYLLKNPFEFPRQQNDQILPLPEMAQYRANQRLAGAPEQPPPHQSRHISMNDRLSIFNSTESYRDIAAQVGHSVSGVWASKKRSKSTMSLKNNSKRITVPQDGELLSLVNEAVDDEHVFIHRRDIARMLAYSGYQLTPRQVSTVAKYNGLYINRTKFQQMIRNTNKDLRVFYREYVMTTHQFFFNHLFVDECKIVTGHHGKLEWCRRGILNPKRARVSHRSGYTIFGGISRRGPTSFLLIPGTDRTDSEYYCNMIGHVVFPFIRDVYNMECTLIQDNASIHVSNYTKQFLDHLGIRRSFFPPQSPDFNASEYVWRDMKTYVSQKNPATIDELQLCISEFVRTHLTVEYCNKIIDYARRNILRSFDGRNYEGTKPTDILYRDAH